MARTINIGGQGFEALRTNGCFYVDKTGFVRDWWLAGGSTVLVCRPHGFGKTLNLDTVRCFLSTDFVGRGEELFGGLDVWEGGSSAEREKMRALQGTVPVVAISFAGCNGSTVDGILASMRGAICRAVEPHGYLRDSPTLTVGDRALLARIADEMPAHVVATVVMQLCSMLRRHWGVAPVVLLDAYDTPMQCAWTSGFWDEASDFMCQFLLSTFKANTALGRGLITGITKVPSESAFGDLNNFDVVTTSSRKYRTCFGFTQAEVDAALEEYGLAHKRDGVRDWYDGFTFGGVPDIYSPWSITQFLRYGELQAWLANTSGNGLVSEVVRRGDEGLKADFEELMRGGEVRKVIDEQVVFSELSTRRNAVWALLLSAGYVTSPGPVPEFPTMTPRPLGLTNLEVRVTFDRMVEGWFDESAGADEEFVDMLLAGDAEAATDCLADVTRSCMSSFDGARHPAESQPERFYHGLVLGLLAKLRGRYSVESNRESGYGRYDVAFVPTDGAGGTDPAVILEFKVFDARREASLEDTVARARAQIEERAYDAGLVERGIDEGRIRTYGIAFRGKEVLVG